MRSSHHAVDLMIDGRRSTCHVEPCRLLVQALGEEFGVSAPHVGCETGRCGSCSMLLDGDAVKSCIILAVKADGACVTTVAGLADDGGLSPLQAAFKAHHALQCGYCTPGMLCASADRLRHRRGQPSAGGILMKGCMRCR